MALRPRGQRLTLVVLAALAVVGAVLAVVLKLTTAAWLAGVAALVAGAGAWWTRQRDQRAADRGVVRRALTGELLVADADLRVLRAHPAVVDVPYLPRPAKEAEVAGHLREGRPVVLVGPSMVGKTRLAAQVVKDLHPDRPILIPDSATALVELDKANIAPTDHVVWLDDLDRFLTAGLTPGLIRRLAAANTVIATLRAKEWDRLQPTDRIRPPEWDVLQVFQRVTLDRDRDRPDEDALAEAVPDPTDRDRIERIGIGEYVGAAHHIRERIELGRDASPVGFALVMGAVDWHRTGLTRPVPADVLTRLAALHLDARLRARLADEEAEALAWATREINPRVSLLEPADGGYTVYDYALDQLADREIPPDAWQVAIAEADTEELVSIGYHSYVVHRLSTIGEQAWRRAADAGSLPGMTNLGSLRFVLGDLDDAESWSGRAAAAGDPTAMITLAAVAERRGDLPTADSWLRSAAEAGSGEAMLKLGLFLLRTSDLESALEWVRRAAEAGDIRGMRAWAAFLQSNDEPVEAEQWIRRAVDTGDAAAMNQLGLFLTEHPGDEEPVVWFYLAAEAGSIDGMANFAALVADERPDVAEQHYRRAAAAGHRTAMYELGVLLYRRGDHGEADVWLRRWRDAPRDDEP
ncbi:tetratricopeptide repeat protein [Saccharothrix stipae]